MWEIQKRGMELLAEDGFEQYEVSAYARPGFECRHNRNYWEFGDYLGIGAGAHGKMTTEDGTVVRYSKTRMPENYLAADGFERTALRQVQPAELPGEFMMNALRLNAGFSLALYLERTGRPLSQIEAPLSALVDGGLLSRKADIVSATPLGRRFLDSLITEFLPG